MFSSEYKASYPKLNSNKPKFNPGNNVTTGIKQKDKAGTQNKQPKSKVIKQY